MKKSLRNYRLFFHRMGLLFLFIPLIVLILSIVLPDRGFSEKENRVLSSLPHLNGSQIASGGFEKQFETYENDQFPLRDLWITLKAGTDRLMGKVESNGVYVGKSGYLMEEFKAPDQTQYDATVKAMTDFAQKHSDLKQYALIAPNSVNILSDRLPAFAPVQDQNSWLDSLSASLTDAGVTFIAYLRQPKIWELILQQTLMTKHLSPVLFREHCLPKAVSAPAKKMRSMYFSPPEIRHSLL